MNKYLRKYFCLLVVLFMVGGIQARNVDRNHWKEKKEGLNYSRGEDDKSGLSGEDWWEEMWRRKQLSKGHRTPNTREYDQLKEKLRERQKSNFKMVDYSFPQWLVILLYVIVGIALAFVVYFLFFRSDTKIAKNVEIKQEEELAVHKTVDELEAALSKYLAEENYREAVRVYFIFIIKALREKEWIIWESKKTNHAYLFEIRNRKQYDAFSEIVLFFEIIWFGKRNITREQYEVLQPKFKNLLNSIKSTNE